VNYFIPITLSGKNTLISVIVANGRKYRLYRWSMQVQPRAASFGDIFHGGGYAVVSGQHLQNRYCL
jgi:hypothetical protein